MAGTHQEEKDCKHAIPAAGFTVNSLADHTGKKVCTEPIGYIKSKRQRQNMRNVIHYGIFFKTGSEQQNKQKEKLFFPVIRKHCGYRI